MRIDAHQHFWRYSAEEYPWIGAGMEVLARDYLPADLEPLLAARGIDGTVAVQARQSLEETRWLLELADGHPFIKGVVGWVDLRSTHVADQLARFASHPRFVGVRHVVQDEADPRFLLGDAFRHGIARVAEAGLVYDLLLLAPRWRRADFLPYLETALEAFSPARLLFGSDWPVCTLSADYGEVAGIVEDFLGALSADEREAILGGTAARVYGLAG